MGAIHFDISAAEDFRRQILARRDALHERRGDSMALYSDVFSEWKDRRAVPLRARLDELTAIADAIATDLDDLAEVCRLQIEAAREFLDGPEIW